MRYRNLRAAIAYKGIKYKEIAEALGISARSLSNKIEGKSPFTWPEVCLIHSAFFPDEEKDALFAINSDDRPQKTA